MSLVQSLPQGALDIVGDIHGEHDALCALLRHLGYDAGGRHPEGRTLVFERMPPVLASLADVYGIEDMFAPA